MRAEITNTEYLPATRHPAAVYLASLPSPNSRRVMASALENIAQIFRVNSDQFNWHKLEYQHVQFIRAELIQQYAPATVNRHFAALRGVIKEGWRLGYINAEAFQRLTDFKNVKSTTALTGRMLKDDEVVKVLNTCASDGVRGIRDLAIISLMWGTGLRRSEVVKLNRSDYNAETGRIEIIQGKGRKDRVLFIKNKMKAYLDNWLDISDSSAEAIFTTTDRHLRRLSPQTIYDIVAKRTQLAGIEDISPHDFRRTFISNMLAKDVDLSTVSKIVGHENPSTTKRYDLRGEESLEDAATKLELPNI